MFLPCGTGASNSQLGARRRAGCRSTTRRTRAGSLREPRRTRNSSPVLTKTNLCFEPKVVIKESRLKRAEREALMSQSTSLVPRRNLSCSRPSMAVQAVTSASACESASSLLGSSPAAAPRQAPHPVCSAEPSGHAWRERHYVDAVLTHQQGGSRV